MHSSAGPELKTSRPSPIRYRQAGVDIDEATRAVAFIAPLAAKTFNRAVLSGIGSFGGGYYLRGWKNPVLVSSIDGVGTKLKVAFLAGRHDTIGQDLVNHCVNDIVVQGARPLFFLDYFATGKLESAVVRDVVAGLAKACRENGCALIGGETAEMPGMYAAGEYDLAGCIVGAVERKVLLTGSKIRAGDLLIGLPSSGLHTNGYSLARKIFFERAGWSVDRHVEEFGCTLGEELLRVHRSYLKPVAALHRAGLLKGAAHITGGGITDNLPRILPRGLGAEIDTGSWPELPVFALLRRLGAVPEEDYRRTFNTGIGMILAVGRRAVGDVERRLRKIGEPFYRIGRVIERASSPRVVYK